MFHLTTSNHFMLQKYEAEDAKCTHHREENGIERSRWVIRAASLRLLPEVRVRSIYQVVYLGPYLAPRSKREDSSWGRLRA